MIARKLARLAPACVAALAITLGGATSAGAAQQRKPLPDFSGIWEHTATSRLPREPIPWTAQGRKEFDEDQKLHWHDGVSEENSFCLPAGMPFMMSGAEGFTIVQSPKLIAIVNEERPSPRFIYIDGVHPPADEFERTSVGHSIGRWEGDELVVDTVGFLPGGTVQFVRSDVTHLTERYKLEDGGNKLRITFTWADEKLLTKPWTYTYVVERAPADRYVQEYYCDPRDPARHVP